MRVYHEFFLVPGSRSTFTDADPDPDPKHCIILYLLLLRSVPATANKLSSAGGQSVNQTKLSDGENRGKEEHMFSHDPAAILSSFSKSGKVNLLDSK